MLGFDAIASRPISSVADPTISGGSTTYNYQVGASSDDSAQQSIANDSGRAVSGAGSVSLTSALLSPGSHSSGDEWSVGIRFNGITIDQGASIESATLSLYCDASYSTGNTIKLYISLQDSDDAGALTSTGGDLNASGRPRTTATTIVDVSSLTAGWNDYDITTSVQEVIDRASWASGNHFVVLVDTHEDTTAAEWQDYRAYDFGGGPSYAPKIEIVVSGGGGPVDYPRSVSLSIAHSASVARAAQMSRGLSLSIAHSASVARVSGQPRSVSISVAHSASVARSAQIARALSVSVSNSASMTRSEQLARALSLSIAQGASLARALGLSRSLALSIAQSASLARSGALARVLALSVAISASVARAASLARSLTLSIANSGSVDRVVIPSGGPTDFPRSLTLSIAHSISLARSGQYSRSLSISVAHSSSLSRAAQSYRSLSLSIASSSSLGRMAARYRALSLSIAHSASLSRSVSLPRALSLSIAHAVSVSRVGQFARSLALSISHAIALAYGVVSSSFIAPTRTRIRDDRSSASLIENRSSKPSRARGYISRRGSRITRK